MMNGQSNNESRSLAWLTESSDFSTMPLDNSSADRQSHSTAFILTPTDKALERPKDTLCIRLLKSDAIVLHIDLHLFGQLFGIGLYFGWYVWLMIFQRVPNQVL